MLIIPTGTDAPIYHWPRATVAVILLNVAAFFVIPPGDVFHDFGSDNDEAEVAVSRFDRYALALGDGLHPLQWVTHNFLHLGITHLLGNMIFLWAFGIVVEGKVGMLKYLVIVLAIGTAHGALIQTLMLRSGHEGHAAGASAVVFGLLAICMIWAPRNELNCLAMLFVGFRSYIFHWDFRYTTVALFYLGEQLLGLAFGGITGTSVITELGHLSGAFWGAVVGIVMLKAGWVDCEGWDLFSIAAKNKQLAKDWKKRGEALDRSKESIKRSVRNAARADAGTEVDPEERAADAVRRVRKLIEQGEMAAALARYDKAARSLVSWPAQADLLGMIKAMHAQKAEVDSIRLMRDYCRYYPADASRIRLKLAQVLVRDRQRPAAALQVLAEIPQGALPAELETLRTRLSRTALQMQEDGVLELEGDD